MISWDGQDFLAAWTAPTGRGPSVPRSCRFASTTKFFTMCSVTLICCVQGDYKKGGKEMPTLVYELACDADLWIFHFNFSAPGSNNDLNVHQSQHHCKFICRIIIIIIIQVLDSSPLLDAIGLGHTLASFSISEHKYIQPYLLVDGIYPKWA